MNVHPLPPRPPRSAVGARALVALAAAVPLGLALAGPAAADAPWSAPRTVGPGVELDRVVVGTGGASLAFGYGGAPQLLPVAADGTPGRVRRVPNVSALGAYGNRAVLLRTAGRRGPEGVSFADLGARSLGPLHRVARAGEGAEGLAVGRGGHALVVLGSGGRTEDESPEPLASRLRLSWSTPGRRPRPSSLALAGRADLLAAAVDRRGAATLLLERVTATGDRVVLARTVDLRTRRLGPERRLDRTALDTINGSVAVDDRGGAVLAWGMQDGGEEADRPYVVRGAFRRRGTTAFTRAATLDPGGTRERPGGVPQTAMDDDGRATVAWTQATGELGGPTSPRAAVATRTARFGPTTELLPEGYVSDVAVRGDTTVVALTGSALPFDPVAESIDAPPPTVAGVVVRRGAGPLGAVEPVASAIPGDRGALLLGAGAAGFRAVWEGARAAGRDALRWAARPLR
ncbi:hypothetical protein [Patulibacter sp.]|uniref:hypothetical protein n=1 Tax=Patulibacter sp. TaxID=1912859 RepID=UPI00271F679D|nr:hypothetical protein [Patulibacter sp.]MDO9410554.1 hypothetical protein [Patulibacter sp.]